MALRRRSKLKLIRAPEVVGGVLLVLALVTAALWWSRAAKATWSETQAYLETVRPAAHRGDPQESGQDVTLSYRYQVSGVTFSGSWSGSRARAGTLLATSGDADSGLLGAAILVDYEKLPENAKAFLQTKGVDDTAALLTKAQQFLDSNRDIPLSTVPEDVKQSLRQQTFVPISPQPEPAPPRHPQSENRLVPETSQPLAPAGAPSRARPLKILYDPANPARSRIHGPGSNLHLLYAAATFIALALPFAYFLLIYPVWKRIR